MARYRKIDVRIWNDKKFRDLSDNGKLAFLLVLTHPDTNQLGMLRSRPMALAMDLGWHPDAMQDAIQELTAMAMLMVDEKAGLIVAPNFLKYNPPNGPNAVKSWGGLIDLLPECDLRSQTLIRVNAFIDGLSDGLKKAVPDDLNDAIRDAIRDAKETPCEMASGIQEQEQEQDINTNKHISLNRGEDEAPAPIDVCDEFENPFCEEPPFDFEPDGQCFDAPIGQLIDDSNLRNNEKALQNDNHVLTASQMIVLAKTLGTSLGHSARLDEIASRNTLTVGMVKKIIEDWKATRTSTGYLIGYLDNVSANPSQLNGKRKDREVNAETISNSQAYAFAKKLGANHSFASVNAHAGEDMQPFVERVAEKLKDNDYFEYCRPFLIKLGCIKEVQA